MRDFVVQLEPKVVEWAVESSAMGNGAIARALKVTPPQVGEWVRTGRMEYSKMRGLARCVKRPEAALLLKSPPEEKILIDYRVMSEAAKRLNRDDALSVRSVRYAQSAANEMMGLRGVDPEPGIGAGTADTDSPEEAARSERKRLGMEERPDGILKGESDKLYGRLREAVESLNILVFQRPMDSSAVRGLSLTGAAPYAILVNSKDPVQTRAVTLLHEYGHALLRRGGVCREPEAVAAPDTGDERTEAWCDSFANAFLMPKEAFVKERRRLEEGVHDAGSVVDQLAQKFKASRHAAAMRAAGLPGGKFATGYSSLVRQTANRYEQGAGGKPDHISMLISRHGKKFTRLTLASHSAGAVTTQDASDYLGTDPKYLEAIRARVNDTA